MTHARRILVIGDIVTDVLAVHKGPIAVGSDTAAEITIAGGGSASNTAAWLTVLGATVSLAGVTGADPAGEQRVAELSAFGVDCAAVRRTPDAATGSVIVLAHAAERTMLNDRGANLLLAPSDVDAAWTDDVAHVHVSGYTLLDNQSRPAGQHALAVARARGASTSVDAASAAPLRTVGASSFLDWIDGVDILFANADEAQALGVRDARDDGEVGRLCQRAGQVVVKLGADGAVWADPNAVPVRVCAQPATSVVDPTGAGDAFAAGFLATWLTGATPREALQAGTAAGARAVTHPGGRPTHAPFVEH